MGMLFPDPKTPIGRLLTNYKNSLGGTFFGAFFAVSGILISLSYGLFMILNSNPITTGATHDLHLTYFIAFFQLARLLIDASVAAYDVFMIHANSEVDEV